MKSKLRTTLVSVSERFLTAKEKMPRALISRRVGEDQQFGRTLMLRSDSETLVEPRDDHREEHLLEFSLGRPMRGDVETSA